MEYQKKQITKEDGRYLVYYHFPASATPEQTAVFESAETFVASPPVPAAPPPEPSSEPAKRSGG